jgi:hypothetical protein
MALAGKEQTLTQSGYDGFRWHDLEVPADQLVGNRIAITLRKPAEGKPAFLGRVKVRVRE